MAAIAAAAAPAAQAALRTPGYRGVRAAPKTRPAPPPKPIALGESVKNPQVLVDAAGTAHIVWTDERSVYEADVTHYCRLPRTARACEVTHALVPPQEGDPSGNAEFSPPRVLASGDDLLILSYRYPNVVDKPDGASSGATYLWTSDDGGTTITGPGLVGDLDVSGVPAVFGPPEAPRIGIITDTQTGGTFFSAVSPGAYNGTWANLAQPDPDRAYSGSLAVVDQKPVAAFAGLDDMTYIREWTGNGDIHDQATWTQLPAFPGSEPRIVAGPSGVFILNRPAFGEPYVVRRVSGGTVSRPVTIGDPDGNSDRDLFQDASGRLHAGWAAGLPPKIHARTSRDGRRWTTSRPLGVTSASQDNVHTLDLAAASDGGGFAVFIRSNGRGLGTLLAAPYGNQLPTGQQGLGSLAGDGLEPDVETSCQHISFGDIRVIGREGCFLTATTGARGTKVSEGPVRLNGLDIVPDPGVRILINPRERTLDTTGKVRVLGSIGGDDAVEFLHDRLALRLPRGGAAGAQAGAEKRGTIVMSIDTKDYPTAVKGFPVTGKFEIEVFEDGSAKIPISLELPYAFGGITGDIELELDNQSGLKIDSLKMKAKKVPVFGLLYIEEFALKYVGDQDKWSSSIFLVLPPLPVGPKVGGSVVFKKGKLVEATIKAGPPYPGLKIAPGVFLTSIGGGFGIDPLTIIATASIGALPVAPPSTYTVAADGEIRLVFGKPVSFELKGSGKLFDFKVSEARMSANTDGYVAAGGKVELDLEAVSVDGELDVFVDAGNDFRFGGRVLGEICISGVCLTRGEAVVSSRGAGACITTGITYGFGYKWGDSPFDVDLKGPFSCDLSDYVIVPPKKKPTGEPEPPTFTVEDGAKSVNVRLKGEGGARPSVQLLSPAGERFDPVPGSVATEEDRVVAIESPNGTVFIGIKDPAPGIWTIELLPGSPALAEVALADPLPPPAVNGRFPDARAAGGPRKRTFSYSATVREGLEITFVEEGEGVAQVIGRATERRGSISFTPAPGPRGRRAIVAIGEQDGLPRFREEVATYMAPPPARPGAVRGVVLRRARGGVAVRWRRASGAAAYAVRLDVGDGRRLFELVPAGTRRVRFAGVSRGTSASVRVTARDASGRAGRPGRARLRR